MDEIDLRAVQARIDAALPYDEEIGCISLVRGLSPDEVLVALGGDPAQKPISLERAGEDDAMAIAALFEFPGGVVAVEFSGWQGNQHDVLQRLSAQGRAASWYWGIDGETFLNLAEDGEVLFDEEMWEETEIEDARLVPFFEGTEFTVEHYLASAVTVMERFTGIRVEGQRKPDLERIRVHALAPHLADGGEVEDVPSDAVVGEPWEYGSRSSVGEEVLGEADLRAFTAAVVRLEPAQRRRLAAHAARFAMRLCGLDGDPTYAEAMASLDAGRPVLTPEAEKALRKVGSYGYGTPTPPEYMALTALQAAAGTNTASGALDAVWCAFGTVETVERTRQWGTKIRIDDERLREPRSARAQARVDRDLRALWPEVFRLLGQEPPEGLIPPDPGPPRPEDFPPAWTKIAPWPYQPWAEVAATWTGTELVVLGGAGQDGRSRDIDGPVGRSMGAYDPRRNKWRELTAPPFAPNAVLWSAGRYVIARSHGWGLDTPQRLWLYSIEADAWTLKDDPFPTEAGQGYSVAAAGEVVAFTGWIAGSGWSPPRLWRPAENVWRDAPAQPWDDAHLVGLADGRFVSISYAYNRQSKSSKMSTTFDRDRDHEPRVRTWRAAVLDAGATAWTPLPEFQSTMTDERDAQWHAAAACLVNPRAGIRLDVDTANWRALPPTGTPERGDGFARELFNRDGVISSPHSHYVYAGSNALDTRRDLWWEVPYQPDMPAQPMIARGGNQLLAWAGNQLIVLANSVRKSNGVDYKRSKYAWSWAAPDAV